MSEFDLEIDRRGTDSFKWDDNKHMFGRADLMPFWVADMDFATPPPILDAIRERCSHPVLGYGIRTDEFFDAITAWIGARHRFDVPREWLMFCPPSSIVGIFGLVTALTNKGDRILVPTPNYGPLLGLVDQNERELVCVPMAEKDGEFSLDIDAFASYITDKTRMLIFSNPHNPTGRVFTRAELETLAAFAADHDLFVIADEVHSDLILPGHRHIPFVDVADTRAVSVMSPNKTFNTAGIPQATLLIPDADVREAFQRFLNVTQLNHESTFGAVGAVAGYRHCAAWLDRLLDYLAENHRWLSDFLRTELPRVRKISAQGTYLAWLDCRELGLPDEELMRRLVERGGVALYGGSEFGPHSAGFLRMNLACPRVRLERGAQALAGALRD
ncbi:MAG: MalY/PatB family protein [Pseudomonadota bacterium]